MTRRPKSLAEDGPETDIPKPVACIPVEHIPGARAMQVSRVNQIAIVVWLGIETAAIGRGCVALRGRYGLRHAYPDDWVVYPYDGDPFILPHDVFTKMYRTRRSKRC